MLIWAPHTPSLRVGILTLPRAFRAAWAAVTGLLLVCLVHFIVVITHHELRRRGRAHYWCLWEFSPVAKQSFIILSKNVVISNPTLNIGTLPFHPEYLQEFALIIRGDLGVIGCDYKFRR